MERRMVSLFLALLLSLPLPAAYAAIKGYKIRYWAEKQLVDWISKGLIQGYGEGSFKPDGAITRANHMLRRATRHLHPQPQQKRRHQFTTNRLGASSKILAVEKGNGQLDPKSIQPIVTNKKVTVPGSNSETSIKRIMIILVKYVHIT